MYIYIYIFINSIQKNHCYFVIIFLKSIANRPEFHLKYCPLMLELFFFFLNLVIIGL